MAPPRRTTGTISEQLAGRAGLRSLARCDSEPGHVVEQPDLALMDYQPGESKIV